MLIFSVFLVVLAAVVGLGLAWRRINALTEEVRVLRASLHAYERGALITEPQRPLGRPPERAIAPAPQAVERAETAPAPAMLSDDPFDDSWVRPLPSGPAPKPPRPPDGPPPPRAPAPPRAAAPPKAKPPPRAAPPPPAFLLGAVALIAAPALLLFAPALAPLWAGAAGLLAAILVFAASLRPGWSALAWAAALGAAGWSLWALSADLVPLHAALGLGAAGAVGLLHAGLSGRAGPGAVAAGFSTLALLAATARSDEPALLLASAGSILALAAILGGARTRLESLHVGAFLGSGGALAMLAGQPEATIWFTPAAAWTGALFLGIAAVRAPALGREGAVVSATGASAAIVAAMVMHLARAGLGEIWAIALALIGIAAVTGGVLWRAARAHGGLHGLGIAALPGMIAAPSALALAAFTAFGAPLAAMSAAALAAAILALDARAPHPLWRLLAAGAAVAVLFAATASAGMFWAGLSAQGAALALGAGLAAPALFLFIGARFSGMRAAWTASAFEASAIAILAVLIAALARWTVAGGGAEAGPFQYAEAGLLAAGWGALALLLGAYGKRGAWIVRQMAAAGLGLGAIAVFALAPLTALNPLWGADRIAAQGWPILNLNAPGYLAPALVAAAHVRLWSRAHALWRAMLALGAACVAANVWAILEIRRAFHGPILAEGAIGGTETAAYAALALCVIGAGAAYRYLLVKPQTGSKNDITGAPARQAPSLGLAARK